MIKNFIVNGSSSTDDRNTMSWATYVNNAFNFNVYTNLARGAAGNFYITNSTLDYLESNNLDPAETMVIIMWAGSGRKDIRISGEWYYHLEDQYNWRAKSHLDDESEYYLFSGGLTNSWTTNSTTKKIFNWTYKLSDPTTLCKDTLTNIIFLENYLKNQGYHYQFLSFANYWLDNCEYTPLSGDYNINFFLNNVPMYQKYKFDSWIFADSDRNCLGEFAVSINELDSTIHPTDTGYREFTQQIVIPHLTNSYAEQLVLRN